LKNTNPNTPNKELKTTYTETLPVAPLNGLCIFPLIPLHFDVAREESIKALNFAMRNTQRVLLLSQKTDAKHPSPDDLYDFGVIAEIKQLVKLANGGVRVLVRGLCRAKVLDITQSKPFLQATAKPITEHHARNTIEVKGLIRKAHDEFEQYCELLAKIPQEIITEVFSHNDAGRIADKIMSAVIANAETKQKILSTLNAKTRIIKVIEFLEYENSLLEVGASVMRKTSDKLRENERAYFLREQMNIIKRELGEDTDPFTQDSEITEYKAKIDELNISEESKEKLNKDLSRLNKMMPNSPDSSVIRNYLDTILELPFGKKTTENTNLSHTESILKKAHYGMEDVNQHVLEFLAVRQLSAHKRGQILCLVGPPGTGKTSVASTIAKAMNRNFARVSLGGVRDEAEIRGHRRTYIGAMPGRIIKALTSAKTDNCVILLDEIDKMSSDFRGDPASSLLEVLDAEQNTTFKDHYIEIPVDLSDIFFIATANTLDTIPRPLLDRLEIVELSTYTPQEKHAIAKGFLIPKQRTFAGLTAKQLSINLTAIDEIINYYTRESGVRNLERSISKICRKCARKLIENQAKTFKITNKNIADFLGKRKYTLDLIPKTDQIGLINGLAWTRVGGCILPIEVNVVKGTGKLQITGNLGKIMDESVKAALSYVRSIAPRLGLDDEFYKNTDIHVHAPQSATPKDGPSAGSAIATAIISALANIPTRHNVALTGEVSIRGRVLPIGGFKEKALGAYTAGVKTIILPAENKKDIDDVPQEVRDNLEFICVQNMDEVLPQALNINPYIIAHMHDEQKPTALSVPPTPMTDYMPSDGNLANTN
jgi:ATP-dependent Lon protease